MLVAPVLINRRPPSGQNIVVCDEYGAVGAVAGLGLHIGGREVGRETWGGGDETAVATVVRERRATLEPLRAAAAVGIATATLAARDGGALLGAALSLRARRKGGPSYVPGLGQPRLGPAQRKGPQHIRY